MSSAPPQLYSVEQYKTFLGASEERLEYYRGEIFAMSGGTPDHAKIAWNINAMLHTQLRGKACQGFGADLSIKVRDDQYTFADALVVCDEPRYEHGGVTSVTNPKTIFEVLSPSTEKYDRGAKFESYKSIASFTDYLLVSQYEPKIEHHRRDAAGGWSSTTVVGLEATLDLPSIGCRLSLSEVYERIEFYDPLGPRRFPVRGEE
ncbi:MAG: Uma2 family endonuclease [Pirellulales bacterium]